MTTRITCRPQWAARIREVLDVQGRSQHWLGKQVYRDPSTITRTLNATPNYELTPELMEAIARALGVPSYWLYTDLGPTVHFSPQSDEANQVLVGEI